MNDKRVAIWRNVLRAMCAAFIVFVLLCVYLWVRQAHFIFFPQAEVRYTPADYGFKFENTWLTVGGEKLHGWWIQAGTKKVLLYLHGNGVNIGVNVEHAARFQSLGMSVLLVDYRGYGRSEGAFPSEQSVYADAEAMWKHLVEDRDVKPQNIYIYGHSLGSAIGIELALRHPDAAGLIVESAFTSVRDMARRDLLFRALPIGLILSHRFDSISKIARLRLPVLFLHGSQDTLVPFSMSQRLYEAAPKPKRIVLLSGGDHNNSASAAPRQFMKAVRDFTSPTRTQMRVRVGGETRGRFCRLPWQNSSPTVTANRRTENRTSLSAIFWKRITGAWRARRQHPSANHAGLHIMHFDSDVLGSMRHFASCAPK